LGGGAVACAAVEGVIGEVEFFLYRWQGRAGGTEELLGEGLVVWEVLFI
jgi:hypothetical protein